MLLLENEAERYPEDRRNVLLLPAPSQKVRLLFCWMKQQVRSTAVQAMPFYLCLKASQKARLLSS